MGDHWNLQECLRGRKILRPYILLISNELRALNRYTIWVTTHLYVEDGLIGELRTFFPTLVNINLHWDFLFIFNK